MSGFGDLRTATQLRDLIGKIAEGVARRVHPPATYGIVYSFDRRALTCEVVFVGSSDRVPVRMGAVQPQQTGQKVRICPVGGDLFLEDVIGPAFLVGLASITGSTDLTHSSTSESPATGPNVHSVVFPAPLAVGFGSAWFLVPKELEGLRVSELNLAARQPSTGGITQVALWQVRGEASTAVTVAPVTLSPAQRSSYEENLSQVQEVILEAGDFLRFDIESLGTDTFGLHAAVSFADVV